MHKDSLLSQKHEIAQLASKKVPPKWNFSAVWLSTIKSPQDLTSEGRALKPDAAQNKMKNCKRNTWGKQMVLKFSLPYKFSWAQIIKDYIFNGFNIQGWEDPQKIKPAKNKTLETKPTEHIINNCTQQSYTCTKLVWEAITEKTHEKYAVQHATVIVMDIL